MIKNLTPHEIHIGRKIPASGQVARVSVSYEDAGSFDGVPLVVGHYGQATDLPGVEAGTLLIVSAMVRTACPGRRDLASPAQMVRDDAGRIIGCGSLEVSA